MYRSDDTTWITSNACSNDYLTSETSNACLIDHSLCRLDVNDVEYVLQWRLTLTTWREWRRMRYSVTTWRQWRRMRASMTTWREGNDAEQVHLCTLTGQAQVVTTGEWSCDLAYPTNSALFDLMCAWCVCVCVCVCVRERESNLCLIFAFFVRFLYMYLNQLPHSCQVLCKALRAF